VPEAPNLRHTLLSGADALTDECTGLPNRLHAAVFLEAGWGSALRGNGLAVVMFDVDGLAGLNERHGRAEGDRVLERFAEVLAGRTRRMDLCARFGGDEFVAVLLDCPLEQAHRFADEVRNGFLDLRFPWGPVTVSAGVSAIEDGMGSPEVLVAAADRALYVAKEAGGNRISGMDTPATRPSAVTTHSTPHPPHGPRSIEGLRILLVDDDADTLRATRRLLEHLGCAVTTAGSSRAAIAILTVEETIDLLVTDIIMPEMSGFTLVEIAARAHPGLPVLYISGYPQEEVYWGGTPGARSAFLGKPMEVEDLRRAILEIMQIEDDGPTPQRRRASGRRGQRRRRPVVEGELADAEVRLEGRIVIVDDDQSVVGSLQRLFRRAGYAKPVGLTDPGRLPELLANEPADLLILDLHMPGMDGFQVMESLRARLGTEEFFPILVLTGDDTPEVRRRALDAGAMDFLTKPFDPTEAEARVRNLLATRALNQRLSGQRDLLEDLVVERTAELADTRTEILHRLARAAEYRDDITGRHAERVGLMASLIAEELGVGTHDVDLIRRTAPLHDIGKIGVPDAVLRKPGSLTADEFVMMKAHTTIGAQILGGSRHRILEVAAAIARGHHERWDGGGYPDGLEGREIPREARIVTVADVFDTLSHARPYKGAVPPERALAIILEDRGTHFDPEVVAAFEALYDRVGPAHFHELADPIDPLRDIMASPQPSALLVE
jgi:cyclic di-GMP phosphodiesterase